MILDMDGVLWRADQPIGNLNTIFNEIEGRGIKVVLATNNATLTVDQYLDKLRRFDVTLAAWQIVNSAIAVVKHLLHQYPNGGPVYVIGETGILNALSEHGFYPGDKNVLAVIVSMDRNLTYEKLRIASMFIQSGVQFIGTNPDRTYPTPYGLVPGTGSILAALEAATNVKPVIVGKPSTEMYSIALDRMGVTSSETMVVGDRLETDIAGAQELGCQTALVLSGVSNEEDANRWEPPPDYIANNLANLLEIL